MKRLVGNDEGLTIVELLISLTVFMIVITSVLVLFVGLVHSAVIAKRRAVASTLANNQMEYLKSLPYNSLAVAGGAIVSTSYIPATTTQTINGVTYTTTTAINYVDDAYDGCGSYPTQALKQLYCRNYPPPSGAPAVDSNPADYKIADVSVTDSTHLVLAQVDTEIAARVAETASNTGALFVSVLDSNGDPVSGATVNVTNSTVSPAVNASDNTDGNGNAIFYGLPPDSGTDYQITASDSGYSTLTTIPPSGSLTPTYPNQKIITQQSSYVTLTIKLQGVNSLLMETTDTSGNPLPNAKIYVKGGYKKYTSTTNTAYYYDTLTPSDTRPTSDSSGFATQTNLVPGNYIFCGDDSATSCKVGNTTYYLAAAVPYSGINPFNPITVPIYDPSNPPSTTFSYNGSSYLQEVRLMLTTSSTFPRVISVAPYDASLSTSPSAYSFTISGYNLPCTSSGTGCGTTVSVKQGSNSFAAACKGSSAGNTLNCTVNLTSATAGNTQLVISANGNTLTMPTNPPLGGIIVTP